MLMVLNFTHFKKWIIISAFVNTSRNVCGMSTAGQRLQCNTFYEWIPQPRFSSWLSMGLTLSSVKLLGNKFAFFVTDSAALHHRPREEKKSFTSSFNWNWKKSKFPPDMEFVPNSGDTDAKKWIVHLAQRQIQTLPKAQRTQGLSEIKSNCF